MVKHITIGHLYPKQMNVYGDMGNIISLRYRLEARGFTVRYLPLDSAASLNEKIDILVGGGGQDSNQDLVQKDLLKHKSQITKMAEEGMVMLMICGLYQLFGRRFVVNKTHTIEGIGLFDAETIAGENRLIGNVIIDSKWGKLVGFENHSGRTRLDSTAQPLGVVIKGAGNNGETGDEGAVFNNVFGSYLHGPFLAKNPEFADELIKRALQKRGENTVLEPIDDEFEIRAQQIAMKRPR